MVPVKPLFIAEVKTRSPFGFESKRSWKELLTIAVQHGDMVAVHTDTLWGGSYERLQEGSDLAHKSGKLCLAKGIHARDQDILNALFHGADLVLVVGRVPPRELEPVCIFEPSGFSQLVSDAKVHNKVMWNQRDLSTGKRRESMYNFNDPRRTHLGWLAQASFIKTPADVHPDANAFIVGEHLPAFVEAL